MHRLEHLRHAPEDQGAQDADDGENHGFRRRLTEVIAGKRDNRLIDIRGKHGDAGRDAQEGNRAEIIQAGDEHQQQAVGDTGQ